MGLRYFDRNIDINSRSSIASTIIVSLMSWMIFMAMPVLLGALADIRGYGIDEIGYLASVELGGVFLASVVVSLTINRFNRRAMALAGLIISITINILSTNITDYTSFLLLRIIAGFGAGLCTSVAVANLASTRLATRNYSYMIFTLVFANALELYFLHDIINTFGIAGVFYGFAIINTCGCLFVRNMAPRMPEIDKTAPESTIPSSPPIYGWLCLSAAVFFYMCIGAYWAYIERVGVERGFGEDFIGTTLSLTTVLSLLGCYFAYKVSQKIGQSLPMVLTLLFISIAILLTAFMPSATTYFIGLLIYQLIWNSIDIYQLGTLANIDRTGKFVALISGAQGIGQSVGPAGAAITITMGYGLNGALIFSAGASFVAMLIYSIVHFRLMQDRRFDPIEVSSITTNI